MSSECCAEKADSPLVADQEMIALVGAPNSGKSSLYTHLTGAHAKTVNYPGSTVDTARGVLRKRYGLNLSIVDTPGTYSIDPKTFEEEITQKVLFEGFEKKISSSPIVVVDATQLARHLLLVRQLQRSGFFPVVALTMSDLLEREGKSVRVEKLSEILACPVVPVNGLTGKGVDELISRLRDQLEQSKPTETRQTQFSERETEELLNETMVIAKTVLCATRASSRSPEFLTQSWDRVLLHPIFGLVIFVAVMATVFSSIFWLAAPAMDAIDSFFAFLGEKILELSPTSLWADLLANGIIASLGAVLVFLPQILLVFLFITILEQSGYLARAASLVDKPLSYVGLNGRSFVPLLSGYACAIPAMLAARTIPSKKERFLTLFVVPLMSCSARLPVYALLLSFMFKGAPAWQPGIALTVIYFASAVVGALVAWVLDRSFKSSDRSFFLMELPLYRRPHWASVLRAMWSRARAYVLDAGPIIFVFAVLMWAATTFPNYKMEDPVEKLSTSYAAQAGRWIEPVMEPMGGDWRTGASLIAAFAAREVFVSSLAVTMHVTESDDEGMQNKLLEQMSAATKSDGSPLFTLASVVGLIVFFMIALQCMATFGVAKREFGSWKMAVIQLVGFNLLAYVLAVAVVQFLRLFNLSA